VRWVNASGGTITPAVPVNRGIATMRGRGRMRHRPLDELEILATGYRGRLTELPDLVTLEC
jgi:hypothetical protein